MPLFLQPSGITTYPLCSSFRSLRTRDLSSEGDSLPGVVAWKSAANPVRMFGNYGTGARSNTIGVMQPSAAPETCDEEIAYQLQLEAIAESWHHHSRPTSQPSSSSHEASSSGSRVVPNSGARNPGRYSGASIPARPILNDAERMLWFARLNLRQTDGAAALLNDGAGSSTVGRDPILEMECVICTEMRPYTSFISTTECNHEYCFHCCQLYAEGKVSSGSSQIQCPHEDCLHNFDIHQCSELLSSPNFEILTTRQTEAAIPSSRKVYCPFKDCSAFMEKSSGRGGSRFVECWACHRGFCVKCNTPWHANMTCSEFRADVENANRSGDEKLRDLAQKEKWQSCAECKRVIELKEGCNHMTCLCGNEFCYICGAKWKNKVATCKCKLWDERNIIRPRPRRPRAIPMHGPF